MFSFINNSQKIWINEVSFEKLLSNSLNPVFGFRFFWFLVFFIKECIHFAKLDAAVVAAIVDTIDAVVVVVIAVDDTHMKLSLLSWA